MMTDSRRLAWVASLSIGDSTAYISVHPGRLEAIAFAEADWRKINPQPLAWTLVPTSPDITVAEPSPGTTVMVLPAMVHGGLLLSQEDTAALDRCLSGGPQPRELAHAIRKAALTTATGSGAWPG